jgi:hypothetical protein
MLQHSETFLFKPHAQQSRQPAVMHATTTQRNYIDIRLNPRIPRRINKPFRNTRMKPR